MLIAFDSDTIFFPVLEGGLVLLCVVAALLWQRVQSLERRNGLSASIKRGEVSMGKFYAAYGVTSGLLVGLALSVEAASGHRVFFTFLNASISAYLCLVNGWSRNKLLSSLAWLQRREQI